MPAQAFNARLAVTRLQIAFRSHVVVDQVQVIVELLAVQHIQILDAREQTSLFYVLHLTTQRATLKYLALKLNFTDAYAVAFFDIESYRTRGCRNLLDVRTDHRIRVSLCRQQLLDYALGSFEFDRIENRLFRNTNAAFAKSFQHVRFRNAVQPFK